MRRSHDFLNHRDRLDRTHDHDRDPPDALCFWLIVGTWIVGTTAIAVVLLHLA